MIWWKDFDFSNIISKPYKYKKQWYDDNFFALDIEVSSGIYRNGEVIKTYEKWTKDPLGGVPVCLPYIWQFGVNEYVVYGREFKDLSKFIDNLNETITCKPIIWTHNNSYEFQFLLNIDKFDKIFARAPHRVIYAECDRYMSRCTWQLTRLSLDAWAKQTGKTQKLVGDLDYTALYTPKTTLPLKALNYSENDIKIMYDGIQPYKERYGHYASIPLTQTGEIRREIKNLYVGDMEHAILMTDMLAHDKDEYLRHKRLVEGGISHANMWKVDKVWHNGRARDITSSYLYEMCCAKVPISEFRRFYDVTDWKRYCYSTDYVAYFKVEFINLDSKLDNHYLSSNKKIAYKSIAVDNGRLICADRWVRYITDIDLQMVIASYDVEKINILEMYVANAGYLDKREINLILEKYSNKTSLKGIELFYALYVQSKQFANCIYGMKLTDDFQATILFDGIKDWTEDETKGIESVLDEKHKKWYNNYTAYTQGIWIVAAARKSLWIPIIEELDKDVIYYDTDSLYYLGDHEKYFDDYNARRWEKLCSALKSMNIDIARAQPKAPSGEVVRLGEFGLDTEWDTFKTLGSKRYMYRDKKGLHLTIAGVNKENGVKAFKDFKDFKIGKVISHEYCKRLEAHYLHDMPDVVWNKGEYDEYASDLRYGICMSPSSYELTRDRDFKDLILNCVRGF